MMFRLSVLVTALVPLCVSAQTPSPNKAYAITSERKGGFEWSEVKMIDLTTGAVTGNVFENSKGNYEVFDGRTLKPLTLISKNDSIEDNRRPFSGMSAACAYDKKFNRLYYAPIYQNQLRYIDLNSAIPGVYIFDKETLSNARDVEVEANHITRMVIASDGNGYALSNDGSHLIRFSTGKNPVITDLGGIQDDVSNGEISVADANTSWGGDMVADASGNLYIVSAHNYIFKIQLQTRIATYLGKVEGLPAGFTTNGAVVDAEGKLVLSSANYLNGYFRIDTEGWTATLIPSEGETFNTSDLANENLLFEIKANEPLAEIGAEKISVFPNPVKSNFFRVSFTNKTQGRYNVQVMDIAGRMVSDKVVNVSGAGQVCDMRFERAMAKGLYVVKVLNQQNKEIFIKKIVVE